MKSLQFRRLVLVSDTTKSANQFEFQKRFNLITGKNNSIGKSTLVQNLFWTIGCEPGFDDNWNSLNCKALLEFSVSDQSYIIIRSSNTMVFGRKDGDYAKYYKITGKYSEDIANLLEFKPKLPNRSENPELETPPPAYYFLPFYIDQLRSWTAPWNSFRNLEQYPSWKPTIVKYHTGYLSQEHFDIEEDVFEFKDQQKKADDEIKRINTALAVVKEYVPENILALSKGELQEMTLEIEQDLGQMAREQEAVLNRLTEIQSTRYHLSNQLDFAKRSVVDIEKDYQFSVECIEGDVVECPLCGTLQDNSLVSRTAILSDKQRAEDQVSSIVREISQLESEIDEAQLSLNEVREKISLINNKYKKANNKGEINLNSLVDGFASRSVQRNVGETKTQKESLSKNLSDKQKKLKKEQKLLLNNKRKDELGAIFLGSLTESIHKLNAKGVNLNGVKHPSDYKKIFGSGGAAESTRAALAYQIAIFKQIYIVGNEIPAPLVIDTPNQQEQANQHYESIVKLIMEDTPQNSQIIMCGMQNSSLTPFAEEAKVIELNEDKLLRKELYEELGKELSDIFASAITVVL